MSDLPITLLVVEDDPGVRTFLADNLTADGYELHLAETLRDAVRVLEYKQPALAILDVGLPDGSGLDLLRRVREADRAASRIDPDLPVLLLTGRAEEVDRVRVAPMERNPQTSRSSSSFVHTRVGSTASALSSANSFWESPSEVPRRRTSRDRGSISRSPTRMRPLAARARQRRSSAARRPRSSP